MARVFILGMSLPRFQTSTRVLAGSYRTEQLVEPILEAGHEVRLCAANYFSKHEKERYISKRSDGQLDYYEMNFLMTNQQDQLRDLLDEYSPDCIVAVTQHPSHLVTAIAREHPLWCDLYGAVMAEAQAKASVYKDNSHLNHFWSTERHVLARSDVFSTCSSFQEHFLIGELTLMGR
ncbi:MAG: hypothetical protein JW941_08920, partial [Candidatus Coatesbacteria bacterium]|nr:hypothetical protein [Candidatus Coatesbacteria bacterium]